jgi:hypothetical protein
MQFLVALRRDRKGRVPLGNQESSRHSAIRVSSGVMSGAFYDETLTVYYVYHPAATLKQKGFVVPSVSSLDC